MILDTNAISAIADEDPVLIEILSSISQVFLPVIALGEYRSGILRSRHKARYETWLDDFSGDCRILDIETDTSRVYAFLVDELKQIGRLIPTNDMWIAALCRQHGLPLLSKDHHFDAVAGLQRLSW